MGIVLSNTNNQCTLKGPQEIDVNVKKGNVSRLNMKKTLWITTPDYPEHAAHSYKRVGLMIFERMAWVLTNKNQKHLEAVSFVADQLLYRNFALIDRIVH